MYLTRHFAPAIAGIGLLVTLFALAIVSVGDSFGKVSTQRGWLRTKDAGGKRDSTLISLPWIWRRSAVAAKDAAHDTVVTITVCAAIDSLPTAAFDSPTTLSAVVQNSGLANASSIHSSIHTGPNNAGPGNGTPSTVGPGYGIISSGGPSNEGPNSAAASNLNFVPTTSAYNNSPSAVPSYDQVPSLAGTACQYYPTTVYPTACSKCVGTSTVTNTYLSTISSCNATQISFIAASTVTVTANLSTSVTPLLTNSSLAVTPSKSIEKTLSLSLPTGYFSRSSITCPNETLAGSPQDCVLFLTTTVSTPSSSTSRIAIIFGSVPSSPGSASASQTPHGSILSVGNPKSSITTYQEEVSVTASYISNFATGTAFITSVVSNGGSYKPVLSLSNVSSFISVPTIVLESGSFIEPPPLSATNDPYFTSSVDLASAVSAESHLSSSASIVQSISPLPTSAGIYTQGLVSSLAIILGSGTNSSFPVTTASTSVSTTISSNIDSAPSLRISSIASQDLLSSILNEVTAVLSTSLPIITGVQGVLYSVDSVAASVIPEISSAQNLISSAVSDVTAIAGSVLPIVSSVSVIINDILSTVNSFGSSLLPSITASHNLIPSVASNTNAVVLPPTTSVPIVFDNTPSSTNLATALVLNSSQDFISSILSDATDAVLPITASVSSVLPSVLSSINPVITSAITSVQSLTPSIISDVTAISGPFKSSATGLGNSVLSSGNPIVASSVPSIANSATDKVNSISLSIPPSLHSAPVEINGGGNILLNIAKSATSTISPIVGALPNVLGGALGGNLMRYDASFITTVTKVVSVVTNFTHSTVQPLQSD